jgi:FMN phosphatase YigB (HAD superfamily)
VNQIAARDDGEHLDTGGWVRLLEYATGSSARVLGKPSPEFFTAPLDALGRGPDTAVVVGDDLAADIGVDGRSGRPRCWSAAARGTAPSRAPTPSRTRSSTASPTCQDCSNGERADR